MKYVILHGGGIADIRHQELDGKTLLQAAETPNLDRMAGRAELGLVTVPMDGAASGSEVAPLAILGYDPAKAYPGPAPFEAIGLGVALGEHDVVYRCDLVTLRPVQQEGQVAGRGEVKKLGPQLMMEDDTAGGIETEEARELIDALNEQLGSEVIQFYPGVGHRHLMVWVNGKARATCYSPSEALGKPLGEFLPTGEGAEILRQLMEASLMILRDHPINDERREAGLRPANGLWLWGQGKAPKLSKLSDTHRITGAMISTSELCRGIGICAGLEALDPSELLDQGTTPDFSSQVQAVLRELKRVDLAYLHVEMPQDLVRGRDTRAKLQVVEEFDRQAVGPIMDGLARMGSHRMLIVCDYGRHLRASPPLPYALYDGDSIQGTAERKRYNEPEAEAAQPKIRDATKLMSRLLKVA